MQDPLIEIRRALSPERLGAYARGGRDELDALALYLWNTTLCEALYPMLHGLEISLRNALFDAAGAAYHGHGFTQVPCWLDADPPVLLPGERGKVEQAKRRLREKGRPLEPGRVVAELSFGFWTALFDVRYEHGRVLWPRLFKHGLFAGAPRRLRSRHALSPMLNRVRNLRNRAFHHEPIWHWRDLDDQYALARDLVGWLCPRLRGVIEPFDRFQRVRRDGLADVRAMLAALAAAEPREGGEVVKPPVAGVEA